MSGVSIEQVSKLLAEQFPQFSHLPLSRLSSPGTDNQIFRLGDRMSARFPRVEWARKGPEREVGALRFLGALSLDTPDPIGLGAPGAGYGGLWSILGWVPGQTLGETALGVGDARRLGQFIRLMRARAVDREFEAGEANSYRGVPLIGRDAQFRKSLPALAKDFHVAKLAGIWERALEVPMREDNSWLHGDLHGGNLVMRDNGLSGVIDWGLAGVGDGACDLAAAWTLFDAEARQCFRDELAASDAEWLRGVGWAVSIAVIFLAHYQDKAVPTAGSRRTLMRVLEAGV